MSNQRGENVPLKYFCPVKYESDLKGFGLFRAGGDNLKMTAEVG